MFGHLAGKNQPRSTQPVQSPREVDMAGLTAQALESHPGLRAGVCISQSLPGDEEDCSSARNASEFEHTQDLGTPGLPPVLPMPPLGLSGMSAFLGRGFLASYVLLPFS